MIFLNIIFMDVILQYIFFVDNVHFILNESLDITRSV